MRSFRLDVARWVTISLLLAIYSAALAQQRPRYVSPARPVPARTLETANSGQTVPRRQSTLVERTLWGFGAGALAFLATVAAVHPDSSAVRASAAIGGYALGSTIGVVLVTHAREGARPLPTGLGALAGAALGLGSGLALCAAGTKDFDVPGPCSLQTGVIAGLLFVAGPPLGAAIGHGLGRR